MLMEGYFVTLRFFTFVHSTPLHGLSYPIPFAQGTQRSTHLSNHNLRTPFFTTSFSDFCNVDLTSAFLILPGTAVGSLKAQ